MNERDRSSSKSDFVIEGFSFGPGPMISLCVSQSRLSASILSNKKHDALALPGEGAAGCRLRQGETLLVDGR